MAPLPILVLLFLPGLCPRQPRSTSVWAFFLQPVGTLAFAFLPDWSVDSLSWRTSLYVRYKCYETGNYVTSATREAGVRAVWNRPPGAVPTSAIHQCSVAKPGFLAGCGRVSRFMGPRSRFPRSLQYKRGKELCLGNFFSGYQLKAQHYLQTSGRLRLSGGQGRNN